MDPEEIMLKAEVDHYLEENDLLNDPEMLVTHQKDPGLEEEKSISPVPIQDDDDDTRSFLGIGKSALMTDERLPDFMDYKLWEI